jgi:hypothetical protein
MSDLLAFLGLFLGAALGQFTVAIGWIAAAAAIAAGYFRRSWFSLQLIALVGSLIAHFLFKDTAVDLKLGGLAGNLLFNFMIYLIIGSVGYAVGWLVMRVLRKDAEVD